MHLHHTTIKHLRATTLDTPTPCGTPTWVERAPVPYTAAGMFAASDGTSVYAGGGFDDVGNVHNDLLRYDPMGDFCWTSLAPSPDQHYASQAVYFNGKIYSIGGLDSANNPTNTTRIYDIGANSWTAGTPMPSALSDMAVVLWNGIIYIAGGYNGTDDVDTLYAYDIAADTWTTLASMPQAMDAPGFGAINGKLYIASGYAGQGELNTLYVYNIAANTWTNGANVPQPAGSCGSAVFNGQLYLFGGSFPPLATTQIYDPVTNTWITGSNMNVSRWLFYGATIGDDSIVAPGGAESNAFPIDDNEQFIPNPCGTPTPTPTPTCTLAEGFCDINQLAVTGWFTQNNSEPLGTTNWFHGKDTLFPAFEGVPNAYIAADFNNGAAVATISNWLLTPALNLESGSTLTFYTRTVDFPQHPDRLQIRMSTNGGSTNVGTHANEVGDFTALLLDINQNYSLNGYPSVWTQFTVVINSAPPGSTGRLAFRYFVENGGPQGFNSDYIGIDAVGYNCPVATPTPTPTATATATATPTSTPTPRPRPTPRLRPTPPPRPTRR